MPIFATSEPIVVSVDVPVGHLRIIATDRADSTVDVLPSNNSRDVDIRAAEQTLVTYAGGRLQVVAPKQRGLGIFGKTGSLDVSIHVPSGSHLESVSALGDIETTGRLGKVKIKLSSGHATLDRTGPLELHTGAGSVTVERATGDVVASTGSGTIHLRHIEGNATVKNSNGDIIVGEISGKLEAKTANGDVVVRQAESDASAATAYGNIRFGGITSGVVSARTAAGTIHIGVRSGTAARFDAHTSFGRVDNGMRSTDGPAPAERTADVRAHTSYGDIVIRRSEPPTT